MSRDREGKLTDDGESSRDHRKVQSDVIDAGNRKSSSKISTKGDSLVTDGVARDENNGSVTSPSDVTEKNNNRSLPEGLKCPLSVTDGLLSDRLRNMLVQLPVSQMNEALMEYDEAVNTKSSIIRNHQAYLHGVLKRYLTVHEKVKEGGAKPMGDVITVRVKDVMDALIDSAYCTEAELHLNARVISKIKMLSEPEALLAFEELSAVKRSQIRNFGSYFMGILNRYMRGEKRYQEVRRNDYYDRDRYGDGNRRNRRDDRRFSRSRSRERDYSRRDVDWEENDRRRDSSYSWSRDEYDRYSFDRGHRRDYYRDHDDYEQYDYRDRHEYDRYGADDRKYRSRTDRSPPRNDDSYRRERGRDYDYRRSPSPENTSKTKSARYSDSPDHASPTYRKGMNYNVESTNRSPQQTRQVYTRQQSESPSRMQRNEKSHQDSLNQQPVLHGVQQHISQSQQHSLGSTPSLGSQYPVRPSSYVAPRQHPQQIFSHQPSLSQQQPNTDLHGLADLAASAVRLLTNQQDHSRLQSELSNHHQPPQSYERATNGTGSNMVMEDSLPTMVQYAVKNLQATGHIDGALDQGICNMIKQLPEKTALTALEAFSACDLSRVRSKSGYLGGILRKHVEKEKLGCYRN